MRTVSALFDVFGERLDLLFAHQPVGRHLETGYRRALQTPPLRILNLNNVSPYTNFKCFPRILTLNTFSVYQL